MTIKEKLAELLTDYFRCFVIEKSTITGKVNAASNEIIELFTKSNIKEKLYQGIIKRELKNKYEEGRYGTACIACGKIATIEDGVLIQNHYRKCPTGQLERIVSL